MSQIVTCPNCGCRHTVEQDFEKYERIVASIVNGRCAPKRQSGYDVIGPNGETYQVKFTGRPLSNTNCYQWHWQFHNGHSLNADFLVLFGGGLSGNISMFLLDKAPVDRHITKVKGGRWYLYSSTGNTAWIWDYYVSPDNFLSRVKELEKNQQLRLEFTQGLGD